MPDLPAAAPQPLIACLNIWNDRPALERTLESWYGHVDQVIAVDGAYAGVRADQAASTDGTLELLRSLDKVRLIEAAGFWPDQQAKRTVYFQAAPADALLLVLDADERLEGGQWLRGLELDVGWLTVRSPLYARPYGQPRLFRAQPGLRYAGRHHWVYVGEQLLATHQYGGAGFLHRTLPGVVLHHARNLGRGSVRRSLSRAHRQEQAAAEQAAVASSPTDTATGARESLRILQLSTYDPGLVAYRLHAALNACTPHASALAHLEASNPFKGPHQLRTEQDRGAVRQAAQTADVVHCHLAWAPWLHAGAQRRPAPPVVIHHHGTIFRRAPDRAHEEDRRRGAKLRLVSNPELLTYDDGKGDLLWLPNPVPVAWYRRLAAQPAAAEARAAGPFRIAHSPSQRPRKATTELLDAVATLQGRGLRVELELCEGLHADVLRRKATCHVSFDSFWLGMQCSGCEAAAMGQAVVAGDPDVAAYFIRTLGQTPYTYANDQASLTEQLERLATEPEYLAAETARVGAFVLAVHDEAAVALRYLDLLDAATGWRAQERR